MINTTHLTLRRNLGLLGLFLPLILFVGHGFKAEFSISHFYYTNMSVFFTGILGAFGLFLFSYRGHDLDAKKKEKVSDNALTNLAGLLAIITAVVPTACGYLDCTFANGHNNQIIRAIHLVSASGFFGIMGWMAIYKFTLGDDSDPLKKKRNKLYRFCGWGVWITLILLAIDMGFGIKLTKYDVFIGETIALIFFGIAWLVKGEALKNIGF
jgi:hypothetical protein